MISAYYPRSSLSVVDTDLSQNIQANYLFSVWLLSSFPPKLKLQILDKFSKTKQWWTRVNDILQKVTEIPVKRALLRLALKWMDMTVLPLYITFSENYN